MSCCNTCNQPVRVCCCPPAPTPVPPPPTPVPTCVNVFDYIFNQAYPEPCTNLVVPVCKSPMEVFFEQALAIYANVEVVPLGPASVLGDIVDDLLNTGLVISNDGSICCESCCSQIESAPYILSNGEELLRLAEGTAINCCLNRYIGTEIAVIIAESNTSSILNLPPCSNDFLPCVLSILSKVTDSNNIISLGILETGNVQNASYICTLDAILSNVTPALTSNDYQAILENILNRGFVVSCNKYNGQIFIGSLEKYLTFPSGIPA
jgi:hypothetical protein